MHRHIGIAVGAGSDNACLERHEHRIVRCGQVASLPATQQLPLFGTSFIPFTSRNTMRKGIYFVLSDDR
jgi:hypothetical protein